METLKKKINKINKEQPLLSIDEIMRLMEEFYDKFECPDPNLYKIRFEFKNKMFIEIFKKICDYDINNNPIHCVIFNSTHKGLDIFPLIIVNKPVYSIIKERIGDIVIKSKIKQISFT